MAGRAALEARRAEDIHLGQVLSIVVVLVAIGMFAFGIPTSIEFRANRGPAPRGIILYDTQSFKPGALLNLPDSTGIQSVAWSADGRYLAIGGVDSIILWHSE